jgi:hypothetical protein
VAQDLKLAMENFEISSIMTMQRYHQIDSNDNISQNKNEIIRHLNSQDFYCVLEYGKALEGGWDGKRNLSESFKYFKIALQHEVPGSAVAYIRALKNKYCGEEEFQKEILFLRQLADEGNKEIIIEYGKCLEEILLVQ